MGLIHWGQSGQGVKLTTHLQLVPRSRKCGANNKVQKKTKYMIMSASESGQKLKDHHIGNKIFEGMSTFKYLANIIDNENKIGSCVMKRMQAGN
jgi:hypothetical protein